VTDDKIQQVGAIKSALFRCPPPLRTQLAEKLYPQGVRVHPELATAELVVEGPANLGNWRPQHLVNLPNPPPADSREVKLAQVRGLAQTLSSIPRRELRPAIAHDLYQQGARVHADLAEVPPADPGSAHDPMNGVTLLHSPFEIVQQFAPELAEQMLNAKTEEERAALREQIRHKHGSRIAEIAEQIEALEEQP
jgi:hypothetical protein